MIYLRNDLNWKSLLILVFVLTLAGGSFMFEFKLLGFQFYGLRVFLFLVISYLVLFKKIVFQTGKLSKYFLSFVLFWICYACISLLWTSDKSAGISEIFYILIGLLLYLFIVTIKNKYENFENMLGFGLKITFVIIFIIALWEMFFHTHLESSFSQSLLEHASNHPIQNVPVVTFDNPNHYSIFLVFIVAFGLYQVIERKSVIAWTTLISISLFLCFVLESRFSLLSIFLFIIIFLVYEFIIYKEKNKIYQTVLLFIIASSLTFIGIFGFHPIQKNHNNAESAVSIEVRPTISTDGKSSQSAESVFFKNPKLSYNQETNKDQTSENSKREKEDDPFYILALSPGEIKGLEVGKRFVVPLDTSNTLEQFDETTSINIRENLIKNGLTLLVNSKFIGYGAGSFSSQLELLPNKLATNGIVNPHNFWVEILTQYGLIAGLFFLSIILISLWVLISALLKNELTCKHCFVSFLLVAFLLMGNSNSTYLSLPINWVILIFLIVYTEDLLKLKNKKLNS